MNCSVWLLENSMVSALKTFTKSVGQKLKNGTRQSMYAQVTGDNWTCRRKIYLTLATQATYP